MSTLEQSEDDGDGDGGGPTAEPDKPGEGREHDVPSTLETAPDQGDDSEPDGDPDDDSHGEPDDDAVGSTLERPDEDPLDAPEIRIDRSRVRHAPRFGRFATAGGVLGLVLAFLLAPFARYENLNVPWHFDPWGLALVMAAILIPLGVLVGCVVALVSDRRSRRKDS